MGNDTVRAQTEKLTQAQLDQVQDALVKKFGVTAQRRSSTQFIGPSWGKDISTKALRGPVFFLLGVVIFLSLYFEWKMAVAAMIALIHDLIITAGIYSLVGFEVTPATVIGFLTILGYSLYDTVVVFDKVRENTAGLAGGSRMTYSQAANLAVNQTLVRSINTSIIALLPVAALLFVGAVLLGAGPLKDLALALFVGVAVGAYSSIFIATPLLAQLKEREPAMQALAKRVAGRARRGGRRPRRRRRGAAAAADGRRTTTRAGRAAPSDAGREAGRAPAPAPAAAAAARPRPRRRRPRRQPAQPAAASGGGEPARRSEEAPVSRRPRTLDAPGCRPALASATSPTSPSRASCSRTSPRCSPTPRRSPRSVDALVPRRHRGPAPSTWSPASRPAASSSPRRWRYALGVGFVPVRKEGKLPGARRRGVLRPGVRRRRRSRCTRTPSRRGTGCWWSTTCSPPAAPPAATVDLVAGAAPRWSGVAVLIELAFLGGRAPALAAPDADLLHALLTV